MKQNVVLAATARLAASLVALAISAGAPALAADRANLNMLGYSEDGRYFAFEEYGIHDGSGGNYSSIYVVDLPADKWVYGSPFSVDEGGDMDETPPLSETRAKALAKAQEKLKPLKIDTPAEILALLGDGVPDADGKQMVFANTLCCTPGATQDPRFTLSLTTFPAKLDEDYCAEMASVGYALSFNDGTTTTVLHRDGDSLPRSRGCTLDYRLYAVVAPFEGNGPPVVVISSYPFGFEGPDRRFLVVPINQ
jgi:predicted secreted protein